MRKEEATGMQEKQADSPPEPTVVKDIDANSCWPVACDLSAFPVPAPKPNWERQTKPCRQVGEKGFTPRCLNEPGRAGAGWTDCSSLGSDFSPEGSIALLYFIFVTNIMLQCCQYGYRQQTVTNNYSLLLFSFRTLVISRAFPLWTKKVNQQKPTVHFFFKIVSIQNHTSLQNIFYYSYFPYNLMGKFFWSSRNQSFQLLEICLSLCNGLARELRWIYRGPQACSMLSFHTLSCLQSKMQSNLF